MKIVHFSDWHAQTMLLPKADLYICSGDMLCNFPISDRKIDRWSNSILKFDQNAAYFKMKPELGFELNDPGGFEMNRGMGIDREHEEAMQPRWIKEVLGSYRKCFANPDAPVVCVRGNHDFVPIIEAFGGDVWEVDDDPSRTIEIGGLKIGGLRGVNTINGVWNDETDAPTFEKRIELLPNDIDILISHAPPAGILDAEGGHWGSQAITNYINQRMHAFAIKPLKLHCFGHVHAQHRVEKFGDLTFSNAATGFNVIEV